MKTKMNESKHKLRQLNTGKYAVLKNLLSLKLKNYLTPIAEQQNHSGGIITPR